MKVGTFLVSALCLLLLGCGSGDTGTAAARDIGQGLSPGEFEITVEGATVSVGPYQGEREVAQFLPFRYASARARSDGFGGREQVDAANGEGPYRVQLRHEVSRDGGEPEEAVLMIQLPPGAEAGRTYPLRSNNMARQGEAYVELQGAAQAWRVRSSELEGTVTVGEIGDHITMAFSFDNGLEDERRIEVEGRVFELPFEPRPEALYTFTVEGKSEDRVVAVTSQTRNNRYVVTAGGVYFTFVDLPLRAGSYALSPQQGPGVAYLNLPGYAYDTVDGSIEVSESDDEYTMTFQFETQGSQPVQASGRFEHLRMP